MRRLPLFLLIDISDSMIGEPIEYLQKGIDSMISKLRQDPHAIETLHISIIAFAGRVKTIVPLMELPGFYAPKLQVGAGTSLGGALEHLMKEIDTKVVQRTEHRKGDWKPLVYLMSDGKPTDIFQPAVDKWNRHYRNRVNTVAIGLGPHASTGIFSKFADNVLTYNGETEADFTKFIEWMTISVKTQSIKVAESGDRGAFKVSLEKSSDVLQPVKSGVASKDEDHVILVGRCQIKKSPYIIKYNTTAHSTPISQIMNFRQNDAKYMLSGCYPVDESYFEWSDPGSMGGDGPAVSISSIFGNASCPRCGNPVANAVCGCGKIFCVPGTGPSKCPWCGRTVTMEIMGEGVDFDITRSYG
ncbi:MAG: VWA domain-containing protein [Desulfamplus sp.]|nr:VWA domain-containing protein [Desulfamplus sp.]